MSDTLSGPQVPSEVDLQDFAFFHLDAVRLRDSMLALKATGDEFRAAIILWCVAWHQVPAASLPDDDTALASYAGCGRDIKGWRKIRAGALRGFQKCSDGRLYHPVLAEKAIEAWDGKLRYRHRKECDRIKKACQRANVKPEYPTFDEWNEHRLATGLDRWGEVLAGDDDGTGDSQVEGHPNEVPEYVPGDIAGTSEGRPENVPTGVPGESLRLKGEGEGEGEGEYINQKLQGGSAGAAPPGAVKDPIPYAEIVAAFNQRLTGLAKVRVLSDNRRASIRKAWNVLPAEHRKIEVFRAIFAECAQDDFLNGTGPYREENAKWRPDFDHLIKSKVLVKVYERALARRAAKLQSTAANDGADAA